MARPRALFFADFTCPFSYVTDAALRRVADELGAEIDYRAFELHPAPAPLPAPPAEPAWAPAVRALAAEAGVPFALPRLLPRTRKAHEAAYFAREHGRGEAMRAAIFAAYWGEARDIGRIDVLVELAGVVGLEPEALKIALDIDAVTDAVLRDRGLAERWGIRQTPTLVAGEGAGARLLVGAHPYAELRRWLAAEEPGGRGDDGP